MIAPAAGLRGIVLLAGALGCQGADLFRVAGTVVNAQTGASLAGARVTLSQMGGSAAATRQVTGADGRFAFDVAPGKYLLYGGTRDARISTGSDTPTSFLARQSSPAPVSRLPTWSYAGSHLEQSRGGSWTRPASPSRELSSNWYTQRCRPACAGRPP